MNHSSEIVHTGAAKPADLSPSTPSTLSWKPNWSETRQHFVDWWNHEGLVLGTWGAPTAATAHEQVSYPRASQTPNCLFADPVFRSRHCHWTLAKGAYPGDVLPIADTNIGPGSLALFLGSEPGFSPETVWYHPIIEHVEDPESLPSLRFDPQNRWWRITEQTLRECVKLGDGKYMTGLPDLIENFDILASLRGVQTLLVDAMIRPDWVRQKIAEINQVWFEAYQRLYDIAKLPDGSSVFWAFYAWGLGKTAKVQCDASSMLSPDMFNDLVAPSLKEQCEWLDNSVYHLDGSQCMCHLDSLLGIDALDAIEWTPEPSVPTGGSLHWRDFYRRVLDAGKSVQLVGVRPQEVIPLLDAIGGRGVYMLVDFESAAQTEQVCKAAEQYR